jgi:glutamate---cysteine ligase / carboxylate-amine ligase
MAREFTIGVEEEFQIIDPRTRELKSFISQLIEANTPLDEITLQPELHQSVVEVATGICDDIPAVRREVNRNRRNASRIAERVGVRIGAASTHPFSNWEDQQISPKERYVQSVEEMQDAARGNLIFGLHVHIGITDRDLAIAVYNSARYFLPHLLALSCSSPFFNGRKTGLRSTRTLIFKRLPRTGIPERFWSYAEFESFIDTLVRTRCIDDGRRVWWDIRPHPTYSTLEFRVCDMPTLAEDTVTLAAAVQAISAKLAWLHRKNLTFNLHRVGMMDENKWRAARYGVKGKLIDWGKKQEVPFMHLAEELIEFCDEVADDLGSRKELEGILRIATTGTSADRQLEEFERSGGDLKAVVDLILDETMRGVTRAGDSLAPP